MTDTFGTPGAKMSLFRNCETAEKQEDVTFDDILTAILRGHYKAVVNELRAAGSQDDAKAIKRERLPAFTPAGTFSPRNNTSLIEPSGYFVLDFDKVGDAAKMRQELALDPFVAAAFVSPSGNGVKAFVLIEPAKSQEDIKRIFPHLSNYFRKKGYILDKSGKDISRLCIMSHDPDLWMRDSPKVFRIEDHPLNDVETLTKAVENSISQFARGVESTTSTRPTPETNAAALEHLRNCIKAGEKNKANGTSRHEYMLSACTTGMRYVMAGHITEDESLATILDEYGHLFPGDKTRHEDAVRAWKGARIHAEAKGALHPKLSNESTWVRPSTPDDVTPERIAELFAMAFAPTWSNKPPEVPDLITLNDQGIARSGSMSLIMAGTKQGKSSVCGAIYAKAINPELDEIDSLGFKVFLPESKPRVVYFDTEQSDDETWTSWEKAIMRAGFKHGEELPEHVVENHICLTGIFSHVDKQAMVLHTLENSVDVGLVIIDGLGDLVSDVNAQAECSALMDRIRAVASSQRIGLVATIHTNPSPDGAATKPRGHLGSDLLRRVRSYIRVSKDKEKQIHTITIEGSRTGMDNVKTYFRWDGSKNRHVLCDKDVVVPESQSNVKLRNMMDEIMGITYWKYNELRDAIMKVTGQKEGAAKKKISQALAAGIIEKGLQGQYRIVRIGAREDVFDDALDDDDDGLF